ncbi:MAG: SGNH/GDSL hydrolase family protein [Acidobacteria bacterium]|nr:SGNH/GDSL hydrolase family protein [Acidobacteriota bacterium]
MPADPIAYLQAPRFAEHPYLPFAGRPGYTGQITWRPPLQKASVSFTIRHNEYGFRGRSFTAEKPPGMFRIVVFGASTTYGQCDEDETWPAQLEKMLQKGAAGKRLEVINLAIDGANSATSLVEYELFGVDLGPDLVIHYEGINDRWAWRGNVRGDYSHIMRHYDPSHVPLAWRLPRALFYSRAVGALVGLVDASLQRPETGNILDYVYLPTSDPIIHVRAGLPVLFRNIDSLYTLATSHKNRFLASTFHFFDEDEREGIEDGVSYRAQLERTRRHYEERQIPYVDVARSIPHFDRRYHTDAVHFTVEGNAAVARVFADYIVEHRLIE